MAETHDTSRGIASTCEQGHRQVLLTPDMEAAEARELAGLLDGTSALYIAPPRTHPIPGSTLGRCGLCGAWITCTLVGYEEERAYG